MRKAWISPDKTHRFWIHRKTAAVGRQPQAIAFIIKRMQPLILLLAGSFQPSGNIPHDAATFLGMHHLPQIIRHSAGVAAEAARLAARFGVDGGQAETAAWLHDISAVIPTSQRLESARGLGIAVLPEEAACPMILHQKLSAVLAADLFSVTDPAVLSAIACHTTLKPGASPLDMLVFIADKLAWDQPGEPPYLSQLQAGLAVSLQKAAAAFLMHLWEQRAHLPVWHPWTEAACRDLVGLE